MRIKEIKKNLDQMRNDVLSVDDGYKFNEGYEGVIKGIDDLDNKVTELESKIFKLENENNALYDLGTQAVNCGYRDLTCILEMEDTFTGTIERACELPEELGMSNLNFGMFVMAIKDLAREELRDAVEGELEDYENNYDESVVDEIFDALQDIIIDDNYSAWGGIACYGYGGYESIQDLFADVLFEGSLSDTWDKLIDLIIDKAVIKEDYQIDYKLRGDDVELTEYMTEYKSKDDALKAFKEKMEGKTYEIIAIDLW